MCPAGYSCASTTAPPVLCSAGFYSSSQSIACLTCPAGSSCASPEFSFDLSPHILRLSPQPCPDGFYSLGSSLNCTACPAAHECTTKRDPPQPCVNGYYSAGSSRFCTLCDPGYLCRFPATSPNSPAHACASVLLVFYSRSHAQGGFCHPPTSFTPCAAGTFYNGTTGTSSTVCSACTAGYWCPSGSSSALVDSRLCPPV